MPAVVDHAGMPTIGRPWLKPVHVPAVQDATVGGFRISWQSTLKGPGHSVIGGKIAACMEKYLDDNSWLEDQCLLGIGRDTSECEVSAGAVDAFRVQVASILQGCLQNGPIDTNPISSDGYHTAIRGHLLHAWAMAAHDPAADAAAWTFLGARAGITEDMSDIDAVFPRSCRSKCTLNYSELETDFDSFLNYSGVEDDSEACALIRGYRDKGYLAEFASLEDCTAFLGAPPILSKFGCIKKAKIDSKTGKTKTKLRIILDAKQSRITESSIQSLCTVLPRVSDAVFGILEQSKDLQPQEGLDLFGEGHRWCLLADSFAAV